MKAISTAFCAALVFVAGQACAQPVEAGAAIDGAGNESMAPPESRIDGKRNDATVSPDASGSDATGFGAAGPGFSSTAPGTAADCPPVEREQPGAARERAGNADCGSTRASGATRPPREQPDSQSQRTR